MYFLRIQFIRLLITTFSITRTVILVPHFQLLNRKISQNSTSSAEDCALCKRVCSACRRDRPIILRAPTNYLTSVMISPILRLRSIDAKLNETVNVMPELEWLMINRDYIVDKKVRQHNLGLHCRSRLGGYLPTALQFSALLRICRHHQYITISASHLRHSATNQHLCLGMLRSLHEDS